MGTTNSGYWYANTGEGVSASPTAVSAAEAQSAQQVFDEKIVIGLIPKVLNQIDRDTLYPSPSQGLRVFRDDLGYTEVYYEEYNAISNPGGRSPAGWGRENDTGWVTSGLSITPSTDWTLNSYVARRIDDYVEAVVTLTYTGAAVNSSADGNIGDMSAFTMPSGWRPSYFGRGVEIQSLGIRQFFGRIDTTGEVLLTHTPLSSYNNIITSSTVYRFFLRFMVG